MFRLNTEGQLLIASLPPPSAFSLQPKYLEKGILMKTILRYVTAVLILTFLLTPAYAHTLVMGVEDNEDGTVSIEAVYSTQEIPAGAEVRLEDEAGKVLWKGKIDWEGMCTFDKPAVPYKIIVYAGPGHEAEAEGP